MIYHRLFAESYEASEDPIEEGHIVIMKVIFRMILHY